MITIQCEIICEWCYAPGTLVEYESKGWELHCGSYICPQCLHWWRTTQSGRIVDVKGGRNASVPDPRTSCFAVVPDPRTSHLVHRFNKLEELEDKFNAIEKKFKLLDNNLGDEVKRLIRTTNRGEELNLLAQSIKDLEGRIDACGAWQNQISRDLSETTSVVCRHGSVMDSLDKFIKRAEKHDAEVDTRLLALEEKKGATAFKSSHRIGDRYREEASGNPYLIVQGRDANLALYSTIDNKYLPLDELCNVCYKFVDNVFDQ